MKRFICLRSIVFLLSMIIMQISRNRKLYQALNYCSNMAVNVEHLFYT